MIKITKEQVRPYVVTGTSAPQFEEYTINYDDGRKLKGKLWYEKKSDSLMVAFKDEEGNNRSPRKSNIDNEIALNGYYEIKPKGERNQTSQPRQKKSENGSKIITEDDIRKYLTEQEVEEYQQLLDEQKKIYERLETFNNRINEAKEEALLREALKQALGKYDLEKVKKMIESL